MNRLFNDLYDVAISDGLSQQEAKRRADSTIREIRAAINRGENALDVLEEYGLEHEYIIDIACY